MPKAAPAEPGGIYGALVRLISRRQNRLVRDLTAMRNALAAVLDPAQVVAGDGSALAGTNGVSDQLAG